MKAQVRAIRGLDLVNRDDVRVIEGGGGLGLLYEPATALLVGHSISREHLDRYVPTQTRISGAVHLAHPAGADEGPDLVRPECRTGRERHLIGAIIEAAQIERSESGWGSRLR
jgi:hypothetical protein